MSAKYYYCSYYEGTPYTAIVVADPYLDKMYPTVTFGAGKKPIHASMALRDTSPPPYRKFVEMFELATGIRLPEREEVNDGE